MNHNYVRKCEEYLQNIPSQKMPPRQQQQRDTTAGHRGMSPAAPGIGSRNLSSRKLLQQSIPGVREKQPINNPGAVGVDLAASLARGKKFPNPGQQDKHQGSKFIRPCCRQQQQQQQQQQSRVIVGSNAPGGRNGLAGGAGRGKASDNVNQLDNMKLAAVQPDGDYDGRAAASGLGPRSEAGDGIKLQQQNMRSGTESWDGILTASSFAMGTATSLSQIKSKNASDHISSPIIPPGPTSTPAVSLSSSLSSLPTRPTSSIVAVPPQPRRPSAATLVPPPLSQRVPLCKSSELETGINLFRFDPLRTLQFLTLELKSKLKALGGSTGSEHKQLYKISKELLLAVRILTESQNDGQKSTEKCKRCEKPPCEPTLNNPATTNPAMMECETCSKLQNELIQQSERHSQETEQLKEEINYLKARLLTQLDTKESKASTEQPPQPQPQPQPPAEVCYQAMVTDQLQQRLEGEIKRLQTMISDKQTLEDGLISDLDRKLQEATSRCRRLENARNEVEKRLLYATLENERLNFLLSTQASTMTNLRSDFNVIENLAHQQIDLLADRTQSPPNGTRTSATRPSNNKASNPIITIIDNHHRNYRHSSGGNPSSSSASDDCSSSDSNQQQPFSSHHRRRDWQQQSPNADTTISTTASSIQEKPDACGVVVEKLRKQKRHYGFKNIAEKESDDGNDANDLKSSHPPPPPPTTMRAATKALDDGSCQGSGTEVAFRHKQDDHEMNVLCKAVACGSRSEGKTGTHFKSPPLQFSSTGSLTSVAFNRFGPARRTILIDSDCELSLPEQERTIDDDHGNHGGGNQTYAVTDPEAAKKRIPLADRPTAATTAAADDDVGGIGSSKPNNDCASRRRRRRLWRLRQQGQETDMGQQPAGRGRPSPSKGKKDNGDEDDDNGVDAVVEKYPRDYGDKFERRESCLLQSEKELCQNRPIIGQIRQGNAQWAKTGP